MTNKLANIVNFNQPKVKIINQICRHVWEMFKDTEGRLNYIDAIEEK